MKYKLICFDLDGTLVDAGTKKQYWISLHEQLSDIKKDRERVQLFKEGKITYKEWVDLDMEDLKEHNAKQEDFARVARMHTITPGTKETLAELKRRGYKLAMISGSLNVLVETLFPEQPFDDIFVNEVYFDDEGNIDNWKETIYDEGSKHKALCAICEREDIDVAHTVFVGNGENDIDILKEAGLGIAFLPESENVAAAADVVITECNMRRILDFL